MTLRLEYWNVAPGTVGEMRKLNAYSADCSVPQNLRRLVEVVVSRINGCTYCIDVHQRQALELGEAPERLDALKDWRQSTLFSPAELAAFAWADSVTNVAGTGVSEALYQDLAGHYSDVEMIDLTFIVSAMNAWNRMAIAFGREAAES